MLKEKLPFITILLRGIGQIMLMKNGWTGLLFLLGIFYGSPVMGAGCLLAVLSGTLIAYIFDYDSNEIEQGLYGFSAALVGVAMTLFYQPVFSIWIGIIVGSIIAAMLQHFFIIKKIPVFTLPFVLITWGLMFFFNHIVIVEPSTMLDIKYSVYNNYFFPFHGFGQVIFQGSLLSGIIFVVAVFAHNPLASLYGIVGATLAGIIANFLSIDTNSIVMGLWSYNAVLSAIVFTGKKKNNVVWLFVATLLTVVIYYLMSIANYPALTFPFVAATIITLYLKRLIEHLTIKASN